MKKTIFILVTLVLTTSFAQDSDSGLPCMQIKKACEGAGFQKGKAKDCMAKITNGEKVSGVNLSSSVVSGCKEKHEK